VNNVPGMKDGMLAENNEEAVVAATVVIVVDFNRPPSTESAPRPHTDRQTDRHPLFQALNHHLDHTQTDRHASTKSPPRPHTHRQTSKHPSTESPPRPHTNRSVFLSR